jgi:hypothetical protein
MGIMGIGPDASYALPPSRDDAIAVPAMPMTEGAAARFRGRAPHGAAADAAGSRTKMGCCDLFLRFLGPSGQGIEGMGAPPRHGFALASAPRVCRSASGSGRECTLHPTCGAALLGKARAYEIEHHHHEARAEHEPTRPDHIEVEIQRTLQHP